MAKKKLRVLVLYGGDAATNPRHELLAWLARKSLNVEARVVAEDAPHTDGAVDDRVDAAIAWADKAIAIITPDKRSEHGAPNVIDEIGRWRGGKGKKTICIVRQDGVPPYSNHAGLVYVGFKERVKEAFDPIREFLLDESSDVNTGAQGSGPRPRSSPKKDLLVVESNPNVALIDGRRYAVSRIEELQGRLTIALKDLDGEGEASIRRISAQRGQINIAYGNTAVAAELDDLRLTHEQGVAATILARIPERRFGMMHDVGIGFGGAKSLSADEIATMRASRILFNDPPAPKNPSAEFAEMFIRGGMQGTLEITESPIPRLLKQLPRDDRASWEVVRLMLLQQLHMSSTVEHVEVLRLTVRGGRLVRIELRARRAKRYVNEEPYMIEFDREVDL